MKEIEPRKIHRKILYWIGQTIHRVPYSIFWRLEIKGAENIPSKGGVLIASNHLSNADPPLIGGSIRRPIYYFAKEELFRIPVLGWLIAQMNAFPVKRGEHDVGAFKKAYALLTGGEAVLLFPEGRRSKTGELGKAKPGVGMLACKANVPVIPTAIANSHQLLKLKRLKVHFGKPIFPPERRGEKEDYQAFTDEIMAAIADLRANMYNEASS